MHTKPNLSPQINLEALRPHPIFITACHADTKIQLIASRLQLFQLTEIQISYNPSLLSITIEPAAKSCIALFSFEKIIVKKEKKPKKIFKMMRKYALNKVIFSSPKAG